MSQRARAYRRQARTDRYSTSSEARYRAPMENHLGQLSEIKPGKDWNRCPHCAATGLDLMETYDELTEVASAHGAFLADVPIPQGAEIGAWWFCHHCSQGGALLSLAS